MDTEKQLDTVLSIIDEKDDWTHSHDIRQKLESDISNSQLDRLIIDKLLLDGYISIKDDASENVDKNNPPFYCRTTYHGRLFLERGGYNSETKTQRINRSWTIAKTIANIANASIVIIIASITAWLTWKSLVHEVNNSDDIMNAEKRIELLENALKPDSLNHPK